MSQTNLCTLSGVPFKINESDLAHYKKQGIPLPTLCPEERLRRRLAWRNDRSFYKRTCDLCKKSFISIYDVDAPYTVYCHECWWSDKWDPMKFGRNFDFSRPFFDQYEYLMKDVPRIGMDIVNCENSDFCNYCGDDKNCYYDIAGEANEDCYYNLFTKYSKNCVDTTFAYSSTLCYESIHCMNCYHVFFSMYCNDCSDLYFCYDMKGCKDCLFSNNLRNKQYCIVNQQYSREEYFKKLDELQLSSSEKLQRAFETWMKYRKNNVMYRDMYLINTENCSGDNITNSKNTHFSFNATNCEDCAYLYDVLDAKDCLDLNYSLYKPEVATELISTLNMTQSAFCLASHYCNESYYCDMCNNSKNLFGCIALNRKEFCILNKQYSREEFAKMREKIIEHMKKEKTWGEFFPARLSPHAYNETVAQEYLPLTKEEAQSCGYNWKEANPKDYLPVSVQISDDIKDVPDSIIKEVLSCSSCKKNYRLIVQELKFYRDQKLPIPPICPECRHKRRNSIRNPRALFERACSKCDVTVRSTFSMDRKEKVYCEKCYLESVY